MSRYRDRPDGQPEADILKCEITDGGEDEKVLAAGRLCAIGLEVRQHRDRAVAQSRCRASLDPAIPVSLSQT